MTTLGNQFGYLSLVQDMVIDRKGLLATFAGLLLSCILHANDMANL